LYELTRLPARSRARSENGEVKYSSTDGKKESGQSDIFVARSRFAVLNKWTGALPFLSLFAYIIVTDRDALP
jgi:hypothetical protein